MSDWNFGRVLRVGVAYLISVYTQNWMIFTAQLMREDAGANASRQRRHAVEKYNAEVQSRLEMVDLLPDAPRTLVLGRVRTVEGVRRRWTSGTHEEKLTMIVSFAGHEIDGFEQWYLDDKPVTLDGSGYVQEAPWKSTADTQYTATGTLDGSGAATISLSGSPAPGSPQWAICTTGSGESMGQTTCTLVITGSTANVSGGTPGAAVTVMYTLGVSTTRVRIRPYLGTSAQNVGADLAAEYPGKITSTDRFAGIALAVVDVTYDPDVFPQGRPNVTAVLRGAKCLDTRTSTTAFTENPALHAYHYARWASGWALDAADVRTADISAAATVCDTSTTFTLRKPDSSTTTATLPRFRTGTVISADADPGQAMDELVRSMAGRHAWSGGVWRLRAGSLGSTVATITEDWLVQPTRGGRAADEPVITAAQSVPREQRTNRVIGKCVDPDQRYQLLPFPAVQDAVLVAAKGRRQLDITYQAVTHIAHAQHLASVAIRQAQAGLRLQLMLDDRAGDLELFDVVALTMPKYGYSAKTFEVVGVEFDQSGPYKVSLAEITADIYAPAAELVGRDPAPDNGMRDPWQVEQVTGVAVSSGVAGQVDGSVLMRTVVTWDAVVGETVRRGGQVEVQYTEATGTLPTGEWPSWVEPGTATKAIIPGLLAGRNYVFKVRAVQPLPLVRGAWSAPVVHQVAARPTVSTAGIAEGAATSVYETSNAASLAITCDGSTVSDTLLTLSGVVATGKPLEITASLDLQWNIVGVNFSSIGVALRRDSTDVGGGRATYYLGSNATNTITIAITDQPAAGTYTYSLRVLRGGVGESASASNRKLRVTEIKR